MSRFFLDRPVFAWVIAIAIMVLGCLSIFILPVSQYPPIAPPSISIQATYQGASAETVENTVTQIIEEQMTGFDNLLYLSTTSDSSGTSRIELTFKPGTDSDLAWAQVENKLQQANASLPTTVQNYGITVRKSTRNYLMFVGLISEDGSMDGTDLRDYALTNLQQALSRVPGVGEVTAFGGKYAMRIWLDPNKLNTYKLTVADVTTALTAYNVEVSAGQLGGDPAVSGQRLNASIVIQNLLKTPEEFGAIPVRTATDGSVVRVRDLARTEMGSEVYNINGYFNGKPAGILAIRQVTGANALDTSAAVRAKMADMTKYFPHGMRAVYPVDTTIFTRVAIHEVFKTLVEAIALVFFIMLFFMGNIRATLIPTIAVPVVLLGTFSVLNFFGYSINMLTMFAMVLAIGLLVDDAIVVVENVERVMTEEGCSPREATAKSMDQITSALVGIALVLSAVFVPMAFFSGSTGIIYRQFSVTIVASMLLSVLVALILTPVLCATLLRPTDREALHRSWWLGPLRQFFTRFNSSFEKVRERYVRVVQHSIQHKGHYMVVYGMILALVVVLFYRLPNGFLPDEDQGSLLVSVNLPTGSTSEQTRSVVEQINDYTMDQEKGAVADVMPIIGTGSSGTAQNLAMLYVRLKDWDERRKPGLAAQAVADRIMKRFRNLGQAKVFAIIPPPIVELGTGTGFDAELVDFSGQGHLKLMEAKTQLVNMASRDPRLVRVRHQGLDDVPQFRVDVDWAKAGALGVPISDIHDSLSSAFGGAYVNDFIKSGRVKRVFVQNDAPFRMLPGDFNQLYTRNGAGNMVPFSAFATTRWTSGSPRLERFNGFPSVNIVGEPGTRVSTGEAMKALEQLTDKLPNGFRLDWNGLSYQEQQSTAQGPLLYAFSVLVIFLCVAALFESWTIPFVNLLMLPLGVFGALMATSMRGLSNDVYFKIGFLTTLGLSTKNAILIVQFIKEQMRQGGALIPATLAAVRIRFRPVLMTSLAFFFGTLPLALANGAGAGAMKGIGTAVTGGMLSATFIDLIFIPMFFVMVSEFFSRKKGEAPAPR
ncbi:MAG: efflux RND transporter permease subunit [Holophaga sp.]|nr:efflux RND transporter permease subunit [Holophaga sp.]